MLPKKNRTDKKLVEKIFKEGKFISSRDLAFKFFITKENIKKISFITPKAVSKKATDRNLLRRRGYFILKKHIDLLPNSISGVFIFNKHSMEAFGSKKNKTRNPILILEKEIVSILKRIRI